ncbi:MAG: dynamin family protein [Gammaproteobacteria bacterium]|nr:dynamin family protein [Gammaproteobacteria bacterium]
MLKGTPTPIDARLDALERHLKEENPTLLETVKSYRELDRAARSIGMINDNESLATRVPWWPLVAVLGTFSAGKSTFINQYLGTKLQTSGNQAVDDKFTVICHAADGQTRVLPGLALDADPRFPFYQVSKDIEEVASGEGARVDAYLQLKTCGSQRLRGKILIDSPGFDADAQRTSTLRITDHIISLSDLVLVMFDARHPEPGAMQDTLKHLVQNTIDRPDSNKFLFILNQIDNTAREDNPEEVFAAWQRGLAQAGLTAGRFYRIYDKDAAVPIDDERLRIRFEEKRDADMAEIYDRMQQIEVERAYRVVGLLEKLANSIEAHLIGDIRACKERLKRNILWGDGVAGVLLLIAFLVVTNLAGYWDGLTFDTPWLQGLASDPFMSSLVALALLGGAGYGHFLVRKFFVKRLLKQLDEAATDERGEWLVNAMRVNTARWRSVLFTNPAGWGARTKRRVADVLRDADRFVQELNDRYTSPSGQNHPATEAPAATAPPPPPAVQTEAPSGASKATG